MVSEPMTMFALCLIALAGAPASRGAKMEHTWVTVSQAKIVSGESASHMQYGALGAEILTPIGSIGRKQPLFSRIFVDARDRVFVMANPQLTTDTRLLDGNDWRYAKWPDEWHPRERKHAEYGRFLGMHRDQIAGALEKSLIRSVNATQIVRSMKEAAELDPELYESWKSVAPADAVQKARSLLGELAVRMANHAYVLWEEHGRSCYGLLEYDAHDEIPYFPGPYGLRQCLEGCNAPPDIFCSGKMGGRTIYLIHTFADYFPIVAEWAIEELFFVYGDVLYIVRAKGIWAIDCGNRKTEAISLPIKDGKIRAAFCLRGDSLYAFGTAKHDDGLALVCRMKLSGRSPGGAGLD